MTNRTVFPFLLAQADQGDLEEVKQMDGNIMKIKNSVKPLMMPSQKLDLQETDMSAPLTEK